MQQQLVSIMVECGLDHYKSEQAAGRIVNMLDNKANEAVDKHDDLSKKEKNLIADLLLVAKNKFREDSWNDVDEGIWDGWTRHERKELLKSYYTYIGNKADLDDDQLQISIREWMSFFADKLQK